VTSSDLSQSLLSWYTHKARSLPWRGRADPYAVWVSEIMLQQTRVETVIPYFQRWMERFPTIRALAEASQQEVLVAWEGLGYYSRARSLQRAAQILIDEYNGELPSDPAALRRLPGIGRYTAGAIASIVFGWDEPVLDGNVRRVLSRVFDISLPARSPQGEARLWALAGEHLPAGRAGDFNQALMDLGAAVCTPRKPACPACPLNGLCAAYRLGVQEQRPVLEKKAPIPHYTVAAAVIARGGKILIARRPANGLLGGLWEFPGGKLEPGETLEACLRREIIEELDAVVTVGEPFGVYRHAYTHFKVTLHAFRCRLNGVRLPRPVQTAELAWAAPQELSGYPMGKIDRQIAARLLENPPLQPEPPTEWLNAP
jgi:A/G-specific adenine glycosylase